MGFLSRLFGGHGGRDRWYVKVDLITELSEIARKYWREEWTALVAPERASASAGDLPPLDAPLDRGVARVQAALVVAFIAARQYLPADERADFAAFLRRSMIGEDAAADPAAADEAALTAEIARGLGARDLDAGAAAIRATLPAFALEQEYITALAFDDNATARRLKAEIEGDATTGDVLASS